MIDLTIDDAGLLRMERALITLHRDQLPFAMASALNDCARAAAVAVNRAMPEIFDRPIPFTTRAAFAPRDLAATKSSLMATVTLRPIQAKYLTLEETGGTRTGAMNTIRPAKALILPGPKQKLDAYGNIPRGAVAALNRDLSKGTFLGKRAKAAAMAVKRARVRNSTLRDRVIFYVAAAAARAGLASGWWRRLPGHTITHLVGFEAETHYHPRMGYMPRVEAVVRATWPKAFPARLVAAVASRR